MSIFGITLTGIFFTLAVIHVYWVVGGIWGFAEALPTDQNGVRLFNPRPIDSAIVAMGLFLFAAFYFTGIVGLEIPAWIRVVGIWLIPTIFLIRAVGDFRYVGLFKKVRATAFGKKDSMVFTPLCLFVAFTGYIYALAVG